MNIIETFDGMRPAPCALAIAEPDQYRRLMSDGAVLTLLATPIALDAGQPPEEGPAHSRPADSHQASNSRRALTAPPPTNPADFVQTYEITRSGSRSDTRAQPATFKSP